MKYIADILEKFIKRKCVKDPDILLKTSEVFCMAPWTHIHVLPTGKIYTCCMSAHLKRNAIGDLHKKDTLESAWNSPKMRNIRKNMLKGKKDNLCERCYIAEKNNQHSFRQSINVNLAHHFDMVQQTDNNGYLKSFKVPYLDIRFSNRCNYRCRICCPNLSSGWHHDAIKLGLINDSMPKVLDAAEGNSAFLPEVIELLDDLEMIMFAGGEPLIMDEHYKILEILIKKKKWGTNISYNTNCSIIHYKDYDLLNMWSNFKNIFIMASLDGSHKRGDYMRKGQKWEIVEKNIAKIRKECPHIRFQLCPTVSLFNAFHLIDFYKQLYEKGYIQVDEIATNILLEPPAYNIRNFPPHLKSKLTQMYNDFITTYLEPKNAGETTINHFRAVINYMNEKKLNKLSRFKLLTMALDDLRNENFSEVFPEIKELV